MSYPVKSPRKLIEVALPLDSVNTACVREKSIRYGHPSTLHLWWARRPLAAARAVIFAQLVNDPGYQQGGGFKYGINKKEAAIERKRLFKIMEELVLWESTNNEEVLNRANAEIKRSWQELCDLNKDHPNAAELFDPNKLPALHDPFAGGGAIPLEAQRLGLESYASDLNPIAVLINKAMIEIPPKFADCPPVGLSKDAKKSNKQLQLPKVWSDSAGLAEDVRHYGTWMRTEAEKRIGHLYPPIEVTADMARERPDLNGVVGHKLTVVAWLWARTVKSPNPAFSHVDVPLVSSFILSPMADREVYIEPLVKGDTYEFVLRRGTPPEQAKNGTKLARGANFSCLMSGTAIEDKYIKAESMAGRVGARLMAIVADGPKGRVYLSPNNQHELIANEAKPEWKPDQLMNRDTSNLVSGRGYGFFTWADLFTSRQLVALTTFSDLITETREKVKADACLAGMPDDGRSLESGGIGATAYADAVATYLAFLVSKLADKGSTICTWDAGPMSSKTATGRSARVATVRVTFARQGIPMTWDFAEVNIFSDSVGSLDTVLKTLTTPLAYLPRKCAKGVAQQLDASTLPPLSAPVIISTDPPYYNNIAYADLSDFFYVWLRRPLRQVFPEIFATLTVPKTEELVATPHRHGSAEEAEKFFLEGMTAAMKRLADRSHPAYPVTIYYAFKQSDTSRDGTASTGWETFLSAVLTAGFAVCGTWPMRTEMQSRSVANKTNALASSIVLVCNKRPAEAPTISRREFLRELNMVLPEALDVMTKGTDDERSPVAPVDLSQAILGPGMAVFSKYSAVLEADGSPMSVKVALQLINRFLAEDDFDSDTQFCLHWFDQYGWGEGRFGDADTLSRAKGTSVAGVNDAGVVVAGGGLVRLNKWTEYPSGWDPKTDKRNPVWESLHHLIRVLKHEGENKAGQLLSNVKNQGESIRQLAYRLYTLCDRKGWSEDAMAYNELITSWTAIESAAGAAPAEKQLSVFE